MYFQVSGFIGKPTLARGNRNFENYFVNGRYVKSRLLARGIEDAYHGFMMQHRYPFTLLYLEIDGQKVDVNVHPSKWSCVSPIRRKSTISSVSVSRTPFWRRNGFLR